MWEFQCQYAAKCAHSSMETPQTLFNYRAHYRVTTTAAATPITATSTATTTTTITTATVAITISCQIAT